ncbi:hypothetical protein Y1Q_0004862 [Alligator mississippiensis]|uniref:Uncharacterized protein n=1 Tax=Alligator mississippiensis TaxID=8496 RepID=A0A151NR77_ALLMI|nr:hypothetical protein Y1Q_0004862 [Alligator mississippiensis]
MQCVAPGTEYLTPEMLKTLTKSFCLMALQVLQLYVVDHTWQRGCSLRVATTHSLGAVDALAPPEADSELVAVSEDHLEGSWAWRAEDITCEDAQDWANTEFSAQLLALEHKWLDLLMEQNDMLGWTVQVMDDGHWVLDTILALAVTFLLPMAQPPTLALPAPWQLPISQE